MQIIVHIFSVIYVYVDVINDMMETCLGLPLTSSLLLEYSSDYLSEYSSTR